MLLLIRSLPLSFALNLVPRMLEMAFQSFQISKFSGGSMPPHLPRLRGLIHTVGYSSLTSCLLQILIETPG